MKYEEAIKRLKEIYAILRDEKTTLEETAELYKEGSKLCAECSEMLDKISAELKEEDDNE